MWSSRRNALGCGSFPSLFPFIFPFIHLLFSFLSFAQIKKELENILKNTIEEEERIIHAILFIGTKKVVFIFWFFYFFFSLF